MNFGKILFKTFKKIEFGRIKPRKNIYIDKSKLPECLLNGFHHLFQQRAKRDDTKSTFLNNECLARNYFLSKISVVPVLLFRLFFSKE